MLRNSLAHIFGKCHFSGNKFSNANRLKLMTGTRFMLITDEHEKSFITSGPDILIIVNDDEQLYMDNFL